MILLIKLILAHLIGDFILQPKKWVKEKQKKKLKSQKLYLHVAVHLALLFLITWDLTLWPLLITIGILHFIIDATKLIIQTKKTKRNWFFIDQLLHAMSIIVAYFLYKSIPFNTSSLITTKAILLITCLLFLTKPVSILIEVFLSKWDIKQIINETGSFKNAGIYIGILERILVFIFIIIGEWEAVGFLITAKSVFSFGNLKQNKHRKLTEYILIGTLISFGIAIVTGILFTIMA